MLAALEGILDKRLISITGHAYPEPAEKVARYLGTEILGTASYDFASGEIYMRFTELMHGADVFVLQCRPGDINKWIMEQFIMIGALRRISTESITVVAPSLDYSRQDKKYRSREPVTVCLIFDLFHTVGADRIMTVDLHATQKQGFFDDPVDRPTVMPVLLDYVCPILGLGNITIVSPDAGRTKASERWAAKLSNLPLAFVCKQRDITRPNHAEVHDIIGDADGRDCVVIDSMADITGVICEAVHTLSESGAKPATLVAIRGLLSGPVVERLSHRDVHGIVFMSTILTPGERRLPSIAVLSCAPLLAADTRSVFEENSMAILLSGLSEDIYPCNTYA